MTRVRTIGSSLLASLPAVVLAAGGGAAFIFKNKTQRPTPRVNTVPPAPTGRGGVRGSEEMKKNLAIYTKN